MKCWEIIADNLSKAGWSWGYVSALDVKGRTIWIADAHRDDGKRFVVRADEILIAFLELERAVCIHLLSEQCSPQSQRTAASVTLCTPMKSRLPFWNLNRRLANCLEYKRLDETYA